MVGVSHSPALEYMQIAPQRDAATRLSIIQQQVYVAPGTIIHSDKCRAYIRVAGLPNILVHQTVKRFIEFMNSVTGAPPASK